MPLLFLTGESEMKQLPLPAVTPHAPDPVTTFKPEVAPPPKPIVAQPKPVKPVPKPAVAKVPPVKPSNVQLQGIEVPYKMQPEDAKETTVEVYSVDDQGKYYSTSPQVNFISMQTNVIIKSFNRYVDAAGNPDPQRDIPVGSYNVTVTGANNLILRDVQIVPIKKQIIVRVTHGSLRFEYEGNPNRPVKEYEAVVMQRVSSGGKTIHQKCTEELSYEPGNYHIKINTLPVSSRNADLDFGSETSIKIPEPGFIQFTNTAALGKARLYTVLGDEFVFFFQVDITGNPPSQKVMLNPGQYKVHFQQNPKMPYANRLSLISAEKSNETTQVELK